MYASMYACLYVGQEVGRQIWKYASMHAWMYACMQCTCRFFKPCQSWLAQTLTEKNPPLPSLSKATSLTGHDSVYVTSPKWFCFTSARTGCNTRKVKQAKGFVLRRRQPVVFHPLTLRQQRPSSCHNMAGNTPRIHMAPASSHQFEKYSPEYDLYVNTATKYRHIPHYSQN